MNNTLVGFNWNNKDDRSWLTKYFLDSTRKPESDISIPNIKGIREEKSQALFELFFEDLQHGSEDDKRIRKNVMSAWRKKLKQLENHKQINIELTNVEYDKLISLKNLKGKKATIKDTILDLIYNEYGKHQDIRQALEKELRKEITQEIRKKTRSDMPERSVKIPVEIDSISNNRQEEQVDNQIIEKIETLANFTNAKFERLESMLFKLIKHQEQQFKKEEQYSTLQTETTPEKNETNESELQSDHMPFNDKFKTKKTPCNGIVATQPTVNEYYNYDHLRLTATVLHDFPSRIFKNNSDPKLKD
ncbi:hypothetical protein [Aliivibrio fischeri]|uniref:hypothetical protein n=1 Tax=Aliivibrio fischeri TaxID=668 RepID=UPI00166C35BA|nr:hypothetical protein [Aliivibrio fischeri]USR95599.1 hypothetical protein AVFI_00505 [Aliivibrio fischeri ATCC 7744 = JCM 18803 = DSM 507]GGK24699.1 hypothetical protein GCM10007987_05630 [Aliivibrio fischeri]